MTRSFMPSDKPASNEIHARIEPGSKPASDNGVMHLPILTALTAGRNDPIPPDRWAVVVDDAIGGDPTAAQQVFAAAARWANYLCHRWRHLDDPEAEVLAAMWHSLSDVPTDSACWLSATQRQLERLHRRCRTPRTVAFSDLLGRDASVVATIVGFPITDTASDGHDHATIARCVAADALEQIDERDAARRTLDALGPLPASVRRWADHVTAGTTPQPRDETATRVWRHRHRARIQRLATHEVAA